MPLSFFHKNVICLGLEATDKRSVIEGMVGLIANEPGVLNAEQVASAVLERENHLSTGVGSGIALPHARTAAVSRTVGSFATLKTPVPFNSIDDSPVRLVFLLVGPLEASSEHLRILSRISRMLANPDYRTALAASASVEEVLDLLKGVEKPIH